MLETSLTSCLTPDAGCRNLEKLKFVCGPTWSVSGDARRPMAFDTIFAQCCFKSNKLKSNRFNSDNTVQRKVTAETKAAEILKFS